MKTIIRNQIELIQKLGISPGTRVDRNKKGGSVSGVKLRHPKTKLSRLDLNQATRDAAALKAQFRREDAELRRQGRGAEIDARNRRLMGIKVGEKLRLVGFGGVRFE